MRNVLRILKGFVTWEGGLAPLFIALSVMALVPVWNQRVLLMLQTPMDLAIARIWHSLHDPSFKLDELYAIRKQPYPGMLFPFLIHLLTYFAPIETANKLALSLYVLTFPLSVAVLARTLGRSPWLALGTFPIVFNRAWSFGYVGFLVGATLTLLAWSLVIRLLREPRQRDLLLLFVLSLLTWFASLLAFVVMIAGALASCASDWRRWRNGLRVLYGLAPSMLLGIFVLLGEHSERVFLNSDEWQATYKDLPFLVLELPKRIFDVIPTSFDYLVGGIVAATVTILCVWQGTYVPEQEQAERRRLPMLLAATALGYALLPWDLQKPVAMLNVAPRLAPLLGVLLLLLPVGRIRPAARLVFLPLLVAAVVLPLKLARVYREFSRRHIGFSRLVRELPRGERTLVVLRAVRFQSENIDQPDDRAATGATMWYWPAWPLALSGGYAPNLGEPGWPVEYKTRLRTPKQGEAFDLRQAAEYEYYLVWSATDAFERLPALKIIDQFADWTLFKRIYSLSDEP